MSGKWTLVLAIVGLAGLAGFVMLRPHRPASSEGGGVAMVVPANPEPSAVEAPAAEGAGRAEADEAAASATAGRAAETVDAPASATAGQAAETVEAQTTSPPASTATMASTVAFSRRTGRIQSLSPTELLLEPASSGETAPRFTINQGTAVTPGLTAGAQVLVVFTVVEGDNVAFRIEPDTGLAKRAAAARR